MGATIHGPPGPPPLALDGPGARSGRRRLRGILAAMRRERPEDYADRLPRVVPRAEENISHLSDEMADLLYPGRRPRPFRLGLSFPEFEGPGYERAVGLARRSSQYREEGAAGERVHHAAFDPGEARALRDLFEQVRGIPGTEVLVDGKKAPYGHELWLPLFWIFVGGED